MANLTGSRSTFPNQLDVFRELVDISPSKKVQAKRYQELKMKEVLSPAEVSELNSLMTELQDFIVTPEYTNKMLDALVNLESFFLNETVGFVNTKQTEMNSYVDTKKTEMQTEINKFNNKGTFNISTQYYKNNFVDFNDGSSNQTYICLQDCMGKEPSSNPLFWRKMTIQGTKGDTGLSGANFIFKGTWDNGITFMKDEAVRFGGMLFVSKIDNNVGNSPSLTADTNYWFRAMDITVTVRKMVGTRNIVSQISTVNFITGEISSFNPDVDSLDVYMNSTRLTRGTDYNINPNNQAIDKIGGTWDGTMEQPVFFEFVVTKNIINDLVFKDGSALSNGSVTRNKLDVDTQTEINKVSGIETKVGNGVLATTAQDVVGAINEHDSQLAQIALQSKFNNKIWNVIGDSITLGGSPGVTKTYHQVIKDKYPTITINNYGENGSEISSGGTWANPICTRYTSIASNADYITVFAGVNDWAHNVPLGTINSTDNTNFYGALNNICTGLFSNFPNSYCHFITPLRTADDMYGMVNGLNTLGLKLKDYANAMVEVCNKHNMPILDLFNGGGFRPDIANFKSLMMDDGLHPTDIGHKKLALIISGFLESPYSNNIINAKSTCRVRSDTTKTINNSTETAINFNVEDMDNDNIHDNVTNNTRLTCRTAGMYLIVGQFAFASSPTGFRQIAINLNGSTRLARVSQGTTGNVARMTVQTTFNLNVGDYIELLAYQDSGASLLTLSEFDNPVLSMVKF